MKMCCRWVSGSSLHEIENHGVRYREDFRNGIKRTENMIVEASICFSRAKISRNASAFDRT